MSRAGEAAAERVLVLTPTGRDAEMLRRSVVEDGLRCEVCADFPALLAGISSGAGAVVVADEALSAAGVAGLLAALAAQEPWSDLPVLVLADARTQRRIQVGPALFERANVTILQRPLGIELFLSSVRSAVRARRRQYQMRDLYLELERSMQLRLETRMRHSQKMEALGRLASGVAHDFNNFLMGIIGCAELAARELGDRPARRYVDEIRRAALATTGVVDQLLSFGRTRPLASSVFELDRAIDNASTMIRTLLRRDIALIFDLQSAPLHVCCDRGELERALLNLVVNAREALLGSGTVTIRTRPLSPAAGGPERDGLDGSAALGRLVLSVIDDGCGMDPETKSRAFEPFFSRKSENTGLGLPMVHGLVQQSGGQIEIESEAGHGTAINISFPVAEPAASPPADQALDRLAGRPTVLVVDDDPFVRLTLRRQLESSGCELLEAADSAAALSYCERRLEALDLLITAVVLPGLSGPQLAAELWTRRPDLPVLYISAYAQEALRQEGRIGPAETVLHKPFDRATLLAAIRERLGDR